MPSQPIRSGFAFLLGCAAMILGEAPLWAQLENDECAGAIAVAIDTEVAFDTTTATRSTDPWPCVDANTPDGDVRGDVWFSFTASSAGVIRVRVCSMPFDPDYLFQPAFLTALSSCGGMELACDPVGEYFDDPFCYYSEVYVPVSEGQNILIRIAGPAQGPFGPSSVVGTFTISMVPPPANDVCADAMDLFAGTPIAFSNLSAATELTVPCGSDTAGGERDVWFRFTATEPGVAVFGVGGSFGVTLAAFDSCGAAPVACSTNNVSANFSNSSGSSLSVAVSEGQVVLLRVAGTRFPFGFPTGGDAEVSVSIQQPPPNDLRADAAQLVEGTNPFTTVGALTDGLSTCSNYSGFTANDIWFVYQAPADALVTLVAHNTNNHVMSVIDQATDAELMCSRQFGRNFGNFFFIRIDARFNAIAGRSYLVRIAGDGGTSGTGTLQLRTSAPILPCITQPSGAFIEPESCGQQNNYGCRGYAPGDPPAFQDLPSPNITVWGSSYAHSGRRDFDWYRCTLDNPALVTINVTAEFPVRVSLMSDTCPADVIATDLELNPCGGPATVSFMLPAGRFGVLIYPDSNDFYGLFFDWPCVLPTNYILSIDSQELGACCTQHGCSLTTAADCAAQLGRFAGENTVCPSAVYTQDAAEAPFEDISADGTRIVLSNNTGRSVDIGFEFEFYGRRYTNVGISDNGYLAFGNQPLGVGRNTSQLIPSPPNNAIFALWDDLFPAFPGAIYARTDGTPGSRRFIASWQQMPGGWFAATDTFQVVLFEGTNRIELRYGEIDDRSSGPFGLPGDVTDVTVGLKDLQGFSTLQIPSASLFPPSPQSFSLTPVSTPGACSNTPCLPDFNNDGVLNADDLGDFITGYFDNPADPRADFNADGVINADDLSDYITSFFNGC